MMRCPADYAALQPGVENIIVNGCPEPFRSLDRPHRPASFPPVNSPEAWLAVLRRSLLGSMMAVPLLHGGPAGAAETCGPPPSLEVRDEWDMDDGVVVMPTDARKSAFRICGDTVNLTADSFPSIIRRPIDAAPGVTELVFDARRIVVAGQLSLRSGHIRFIADEVEFAPGCLITLVDPPPAGNGDPAPGTLAQDGDGVTVVCRSLVFGATVTTPFAFFLEGGQAGKPACRLHVVAKTMTIRGRTVPPAEAAAALGRLTLNAVFPPEGAAGGTPAALVTLGDAAGPVYGELFRTQALWPMAFAAKMRRVHAGAPYDAATKTRLASFAASYSPQLELWRSPGPFSQVQGITAAMEADLCKSAVGLVADQRGNTLDVHIPPGSGICAD